MDQRSRFALDRAIKWLATKLPIVKRLWYEILSIRSIQRAVCEQGLRDMQVQLAQAVPDITQQYTSFVLDSEYLRTKVRAQHAFQIALVRGAITRFFRDEENITVVDIGDSAGTHIQYIRALNPDRNLRCLSVNPDPEAVRKIRSKGLEAIQARAEDLSSYAIDASMFLCFETLEHLMEPARFLKSLADNTNCTVLVVTVPYLAQSRVGLHHIRHLRQEPVNPENTHIFEFSPADWKLLFMHSGWEVEHDSVYLQYPRKNILRLTKALWKRTDFEGFYGVLLTQDSTWSNLYSGWD